MKKTVSFLLACVFMISAFVAIGMQFTMHKTSANFEYLTDFASTDIVSTNDEILDEKFSVSIFGEASKKISPDLATIHASIETLDMDKMLATQQNQDLFEKLLSSLEAAGISSENIVFEGTNCNNACCDNYCNDNGFRVSTSFSIETKTSQLSQISQILMENVGTKLNYVNFRLSNQEEVYQEVLAQALQKAKIKAKTLTQNENLQMVNVKEEQVYCCNNLYRDFHNCNIENISIGQIEVEAKVVVSFA